MGERQYHGLSHILLSALWSETATFIFLTALIFSHVTKIVPTLSWKKEKRHLVWLKTSHFALGGNLHISTDVLQQLWVFVVNVVL